MHGIQQAAGLAHQSLHLVLGDAVRDPVVAKPLRIALTPRAHALGVVLAALEDRHAGQVRDVTGTADVIRMHVRDHDPLQRAVERVEHGQPPLLWIAGPEPGVDERPATTRRRQEIAMDMVEAEREAEGHATDPVCQVEHL